MGISKQAVSQLMEALVTLGYVARHPAPDDRRRTLLQLTARGRAAVHVIDDTAAALEVAMATAIGGDALRALHAALQDLDQEAAAFDPPGRAGARPSGPAS
jgi:DNA-binding MarR family transcriptional regulator